MKRTIALAALLTACLAVPAAAKNVDLVTLPGRDSVQLTIYNSEDITLVKETRSITLKKGVNQLQFSWANTLIDPTSVELRPLEHADEVEVLHTVFPGQKPQHLIWHVDSKFEGQVKVEVTYFTSGLTWSMDYVSVTDPDETVMDFDGHVRVFNRSGEEYENAEIRLMVGTINLVEKIAALARRQGIPTPKPGTASYSELRRKGARRSFAAAEKAAGGPPAERKQIVKEGLSEYFFMFTVAGTETIKNGWSKRMIAVDADQVPFEILYRMRHYQYGFRPIRFYIWQNDAEHKLGDSPLPDGRVRVFRDDGKDGLSFMGDQLLRYVPIKAKIEVNLGPDDLVVYESRKMSTKRFSFHFRWSNRREYVDGWDEQQQWIDTFRNYRTKPVKFEFRRQWNGHVDYTSEVKTTLFDYRTIQAAFTVGARDKLEYPCTVVFHHGVNSKQNRIFLKRGR